MRATRVLCLALTLAGAALPAAEALPLFATAKLGNASLDASFGDRFAQVIDGDDDSWGVGLGVRLGKRLAVVAEYQDLGSAPGVGAPCPQSADLCPAVLVPIEADSTATTLSAQLHWPLLRQRLLLYGKAGVVSWSSDVSRVLDAAEQALDDYDDEGLVLGVGLRVNLPGPLDVFGEIERLAEDFELVAVGVTFGF